MATDQIYQIYRSVASSTVQGSFSYTCSGNTIAANYGITYPAPITSPGTVLLINAQGFRRSVLEPTPGAVRYIVCDENGTISWPEDPPYNAYQIFELNESMSNENRPVYLEVAWRPQPAEKPKRVLDL